MVWLKCLLVLSLFQVGICHPSEPPNSQDSLSCAISGTLSLSGVSNSLKPLIIPSHRENDEMATSTLSVPQYISSLPSLYNPVCTRFSPYVRNYEAETEYSLYPTQSCISFPTIFTEDLAGLAGDMHQIRHIGVKTEETPEASLSIFKSKFDQLLKDRRVKSSLMTSFMQIPPYSSYTADSTNPVVFSIVPLQALTSSSELMIDITRSFSLPTESSSYVCKYSILNDSCPDGSTCKQGINCAYDVTSKSLKITGFTQGITDDLQITIEGSGGGLKYPSTPGLYNIPITFIYSGSYTYTGLQSILVMPSTVSSSSSITLAHKSYESLLYLRNL